MHLAFGVASTDRTPLTASEMYCGCGCQEFRGRSQTGVQYAKQCTAGQQQTLLDIAAAIDVGIVNQTLPTDCGTRLFEIHAHHNQQFAAQLVFQRGQTTGVIERCSRIMHGTWAYNHQQSIILTI